MDTPIKPQPNFYKLIPFSPEFVSKHLHKQSPCNALASATPVCYSSTRRAPPPLMLALVEHLHHLHSLQRHTQMVRGPEEYSSPINFSINIMMAYRVFFTLVFCSLQLPQIEPISLNDLLLTRFPLGLNLRYN